MATPNVQTQIGLALRTKLEALVLTPALPVLWSAKTQPLPAGNCIEAIPHKNRPNRFLIASDAPSERLGIMQANLLTTYTSADNAQTVIDEIAGDIADHFVVDEPLRYGSVTVRVYEPPEVVDTMNDEKRARMMTPVMIRWRCWA